MLKTKVRTMPTSTLTKIDWLIPAPFWIETFFMPTYVEQVEVIDKKKVVKEMEIWRGPVSRQSYGHTLKISFIYVRTSLGDAKVQVSELHYDVLEAGDTLKVTYKQSRFSRRVRAGIAR